jgi:tetratricopeptide (TPR) repeat protein
MLVDCMQRGGGFYWYVIMWMPFGPLAYFFAVKIHDYDLRPLKRLLRFERPPGAAALRFRLQESATPANKLALAQELVARKESVDEAADLFREVLRWDPDERRAQYGLSVAMVQKGDVAAALELLARLVARDPKFHDYDAWRELAELRWNAGQKDVAIADLEALVQSTARLEHRFLLASRLAEVGRKDEAKQLLEAAIETYKHSPRYIQRRDARPRRAARKLLTDLTAAA